MEGILFSKDEKGGSRGVELGCLGGQKGEGQSIGQPCRCPKGSQYSKGRAHGHEYGLFGGELNGSKVVFLVDVRGQA
jgi:hypothetical protein